MKIRKDSVRNWPLQIPPFDRNFTLSPLEKTALSTWKAQGQLDKYSRKIKHETKQQLNRLTQPIEAALLHYGISKGGESMQHACVLLLLHEMHRRQTSLWAWDESAWIGIIGHTKEEFKSRHQAFEHAHHLSAIPYRACVMACAYILSEIPIYQLVTDYQALVSAQHMFGGVAVKKAIQELTTESTRIGRGSWLVSAATCTALLANRNPDLRKLTLPVLEKLHETYAHHKSLKNGYILLSTLLYNFKILPACLPSPCNGRVVTTGKDDTLSPDWARLLQTWYDTSPDPMKVRKRKRGAVAKAARWAAEMYPDVASAQQWTRSTAIAYVAAVTRMMVGQWQHPLFKSTRNPGKPLRAAYQMALLSDLRSFFNDCHEWGWFPMSFNPDRYLATPRSVLAKRGPNPRPIAPATWAKLQEAGLSLTQEDLPVANLIIAKQGNVAPDSWYPLEMVRAMAIMWLYTGLRSDEIRRLRVGCIRLTPREENKGSSSSAPPICSLTVPQGKNQHGFSKPVPGFVGDDIGIWEKSRPHVPKHWDYNTAEAVDFLFVWRGKLVGRWYLNLVVIPMLCRKAGIPVEDDLGKITSHRARHTLAHQLRSAPTPMSDSDLQDWFGHFSASSLEWYATTNKHRLDQGNATLNHISVDKRQLEQLKNPTTNVDEPAAEGESVPSVDLGHGFCTYDFFAECRQRTPCANCSFYKPKVSLLSQLHEAKSQLQRMLHSLPLSQEVRQAIEDAIAANETLVAIMRRNQEDDSSKSEGSAAAGT
jgi:integrase